MLWWLVSHSDGKFDAATVTHDIVRCLVLGVRGFWAKALLGLCLGHVVAVVTLLVALLVKGVVVRPLLFWEL